MQTVRILLIGLLIIGLSVSAAVSQEMGNAINAESAEMDMGESADMGMDEEMAGEAKVGEEAAAEGVVVEEAAEEMAEEVVAAEEAPADAAAAEQTVEMTGKVIFVEVVDLEDTDCAAILEPEQGDVLCLTSNETLTKLKAELPEEMAQAKVKGTMITKDGENFLSIESYEILKEAPAPEAVPVEAAPAEVAPEAEETGM